MSITDPIKNAIIYALLTLCAGLGGATFIGHARLGIAQGQRDNAAAALKRVNTAVEAQNAQAKALLHNVSASVLAQQKTIDVAHVQQEKTDAKNQKDINGYRTDLQRLRVARGVLDATERPSGTGRPVANGKAPPGPGGRAADQAYADSVLSAAPHSSADADADAYDADRINVAYAACRADAFAVRGLPEQ